MDTFYRNQIGSQYQGCASDKMKEFECGEEVVVRSLRNGGGLDVRVWILLVEEEEQKLESRPGVI